MMHSRTIKPSGFSRSPALMLVFNVIGLTGCCGLFFIVPSGHSGVVTAFSSVFFASAIIQAWTNPQVFLHKTRFNGEFLFLVFSYLVFLHPYLNALITEFTIQEQSRFTQNYWEYSNRAIILSTVGILSFSCGARIAQILPFKKKVHVARGEINPLFVWMLIGFWASSVLLFFAFGGSSFFSPIYDRQAQGDSSAYSFFVLATMASAISGPLFLYSYFIRKKLSIPLVIIGLQCMIWFLATAIIGDRGSSFTIAIAVAAVLFAYKFSFKIPLAIALTVAAIFISGAIQTIRMTGDRSVGAFVEALVDPQKRRGVEESSVSTATAVTRAALHEVPNNYPHFGGRLTVTAALSPIPFARGAFKDPDNRFSRSSDLFTYSFVGTLRRYGTGTSIVADTYVDLGLLHVILMLTFAGFVIRRLSDAAALYKDSYQLLVLFAVGSAFFAVLPRYGMAWPVREIVWTAILLYSADWLVRVPLFKKIFQSRF